MRLVTFGCSRTYGMGLPDVYPDNKKQGSDYAWPVHFKNYYNYDSLLNLARPGVDNSHIARTVLDFTTSDDEDSFYIIQWATPNRISFYDEKDNKYDFYGIWSLEDKDPKKATKAKFYYENFFSGYQSKINTIMMIYMIQLHMEKINKKYFMFTFTNSGIFEIDFDFFKNLPIDGNTIYPINSSHVEEENTDIALDNNHNGVKFHKRFAEILIAYHNKNNSF